MTSSGEEYSGRSEVSVYEETDDVESAFYNSPPLAMSITLRDIEESFSTFTGKDAPGTYEWIADFEINYITVGKGSCKIILS